MATPQDFAAAGAVADTEEDPSLDWWHRLQLPLLAAIEASGTILLLGGADGSCALRCSVLLPMLMLQHGWAPQQHQQLLQQQHIIVALETRAAAESAAAAGKDWGGGFYASCIARNWSDRSSSSRRSFRHRLLYLTTQQLLQWLLQEPLLPGCCAIAVEVSLQHGFCTELLLPLLQRVRQRRPLMRLLLLLPPGWIAPQWALHLAAFFAAANDASAAEAAVTPQGALEALRNAVEQQQQHLEQFLNPIRGRLDVQQQEQQQQQQKHAKRQRSSSLSEADDAAAAAATPDASGAPMFVESLSSNSRSRSSSSSGSDVSCVSVDEVVVLRVSSPPPKRKNKKQHKRQLKERLQKIQRKLKKLINSTGTATSSTSRSRGMPLLDTEGPLGAPRRFLGENTHASRAPSIGSTDETRAAVSPATEAAPDPETHSRAPHPLEGPSDGTGAPPPQPPERGPLEGPLFPVKEGEKKALSSVCIVGVCPPAHRVSIRYLKKPTANFVRAAASIGQLQLLLLPVALLLLVPS